MALQFEAWAAPIAEAARQRRIEEELRLEEEETRRRDKEEERRRKLLKTILSSWGITEDAMRPTIDRTSNGTIGNMRAEETKDGALLCVKWGSAPENVCRYTATDRGRDAFAERYMEEVAKCQK